MISTNTHGGRREGAGRPSGSLNKRSLEVIQEVAEKYPEWSPLMHLAAVANNETLDAEIRLDAAKAAAPYVHAKLKPVTADADELVELERRLHSARLQAAADVLAESPGLMGLADRLSRALARTDNSGDAVGLSDAVDAMVLMNAAAPRVIDVTPSSAAAEPTPAQAASQPSIAPTGDWTPRPAYEPIIEQKQSFCYDDYESLPGSLLSSYRNS